MKIYINLKIMQLTKAAAKINCFYTKRAYFKIKKTLCIILTNKFILISRKFNCKNKCMLKSLCKY